MELSGIFCCCYKREKHTKNIIEKVLKDISSEEKDNSKNGHFGMMKKKKER